MENKLLSFNENFPIGTPIIYTDDFGEKHETSTRSQAWQLGHGDIIVAINGRSGGYDINRIQKRKVK